MYADDARWLMDTIIRKTIDHDLDGRGCVRLDSRIIKQNMCKHKASDVISCLAEGQAIDILPATPGSRSTGFRIGARFLADRHVRVFATDPRLIERVNAAIDRMNKEDPSAPLLPIHEQLNEGQKCLSITDDADAIIESLKPKAIICQDVLVGNIRQQDYPFSVSSTGRVFNAITGLKRELRQCLRIDGDRVGSVDIRCAQPAFLAMLIQHANTAPTADDGVNQFDRGVQRRGPGGQGPGATRNPIPICNPLLPPVEVEKCCQVAKSAEFETYKSLVCSGEFYPWVASKTGLDLQYVKDRFIKDVLAKDIKKRGDYPSEVQDAFRSLFPSVFKFVREMNSDDHGTLIRLLQRMESRLVIESLSPRLLGRISFVTLHDEVYAQKTDLHLVRSEFDRMFDEIGFRMALKEKC